ncbi:MAG: hypothetical protein R6W94_11390 [Spirochaetia bacterium]
MAPGNLDAPPTRQVVVRSLIAAAGAAIVNNLYSVIYTAITGFSIPEVINAGSITTFSVLPVLLGGLVYWGVSRFSLRVANIVLAVGTVALFIVFTIPTFGETIQTPGMEPMPTPEGFVGLSLGLHFAGPILLLALVPHWRTG